MERFLSKGEQRRARRRIICSLSYQGLIGFNRNGPTRAIQFLYELNTDSSKGSSNFQDSCGVKPRYIMSPAVIRFVCSIPSREVSILLMAKDFSARYRLFLGGQSLIILGYRRLSVSFLPAFVPAFALSYCLTTFY